MLKACFGLCAASAIWACGEGQAEHDYLGEPLLTAHGSVVSSDLALGPELTLGLQFEESRASDHLWVRHFVKTEVVGSFPGAFTMRIYEPPPPEVAVAIVPGEPAFATSSLVTVRPDHPDWLSQQGFGSIRGGPLVVRTCANDGECRDFDLNAPPCGLGPDYRPCPADDAWTTYLPISDTYEYRFVYFAEAAPAGSVLSRYFAGGQPVTKGYHLVILRQVFEEGVNETDPDIACLVRADQRAIAAINTRHGGAPSDPAFEAEMPGEHIIAMVAEGCSQPNVKWVDDPNSASLRLSFLAWNQFRP